MLDTLGVIVAGAAHADTQRLADIWPSTGGESLLSVGGHHRAEYAALINGSAAHIWDFDDTSYTGIMHGSAVIFPVVMALAQELGRSDDETRTAFIIGSEIAYVLADICTHQHYLHGWWSTVTFGLVGATAAAARLLGCNEEQTTQAIGVAAAAAGGGKSVFGTRAKPFLVGETAKRAVEFARFAAGGLTGPSYGFYGETGFLHRLNNDICEQAGIETLGKRWRLTNPGLLIKRNPVCSAAHAIVETVAQLTFDTGINPTEIQSIHVEVPEIVRISLAYDTPATPTEAQFSIPFAAACAAMYGTIRLTDLSAENLCSPDLQQIMQTVQIAVADDLSTREMREKFPESARVRIVMADNSEKNGFCGEAYGMPGRPLSDADFMSKFQGCLDFSGRTISAQEIREKSVTQLTNELFRKI